MKRIGAPSDGSQLRDICFNRDGTLYGISLKGTLHTVHNTTGFVSKVLDSPSHINSCIRSNKDDGYDCLMWMPFDPSLVSAAPEPAKVQQKFQTDVHIHEECDLLKSMNIDMNHILPSKQIITQYNTNSNTNTHRRQRRNSYLTNSNYNNSSSNSNKKNKSHNSEYTYLKMEQEEEEKMWIAVSSEDVNVPVYYYHKRTRETSWTNPEEHKKKKRPPPPPPPRTKRPMSLDMKSRKEENVLLYAFLSGLKLEKYLPEFVEECLTMEQLSCMALKDRELDWCLKEIGVAKMGERMKIKLALC